MKGNIDLAARTMPRKNEAGAPITVSPDSRPKIDDELLDRIEKFITRVYDSRCAMKNTYKIWTEARDLSRAINERKQ